MSDVMKCLRCKGPLPLNEKAAYGDRCENCYCETFAAMGRQTVPGCLRMRIIPHEKKKPLRDYDGTTA
jgi:hypothetical protein